MLGSTGTAKKILVRIVFQLTSYDMLFLTELTIVSWFAKLN